MNQIIKDAQPGHWTYKLPARLRPYAQLARYDRPIGYWLLALPGWIGLAFAALTAGLSAADIKWAALILIGAIAMRGAGCTYNDIVDKDLDAKVERTAARPIPAGTVSVSRAWLWLALQLLAGLLVLLSLPRAAQVTALLSLPLAAAYPFMKRISWWPQLWLGLTFNWAVLVAYVIKMGAVSAPALVLYAGLVFWTLGYDTIYACQDIEDDELAGIKSSARRLGSHIKSGVALFYAVCVLLVCLAVSLSQGPLYAGLASLPFAAHLFWQSRGFDPDDGKSALRLFKSNKMAGLLLAASAALLALALQMT